MERDELDNFLDELVMLVRQSSEGRDNVTVENTRDRVRRAFFKMLPNARTE